MFILLVSLCGLSACAMNEEVSQSSFRADIETEVAFQTSDRALQKLFDTAETKLKGNLVRFTPSMQVLVEGGGYQNAWIETQPMGGEMYARRDVQTALNNQVIFMLGQRLKFFDHAVG